MPISHFMNCNKVKNMGVSSASIASACADSTLVEVHADKKQIRRVNNASLPEKVDKKRDVKAAEKTPVDEGED